MNIPGYQLGREISSGEFCSIYNALEVVSSKTVTVKFFHSQLSSNPDFCEHLRKTSQQLLNKSIGNIIPVKMAESSPDGCYLVTGYFPCTKCNQPLPTEFSTEEILTFGLQIADGLTRLHNMGLVHGAVSTNNLIFSDSSQVILGLMSFQRTIKQGVFLPTIPLSIDEASYIAPEYSAGKGLDARSDFYSLGVVLYELIFKTKPFIADSLQKLLFYKVKKVFAQPNLDLKNLDALFERLLTPDPSQRIFNVKDYIKAVEQCGYKINNARASINTPDKTPPQISNTKKSETKTSKNKNFVFYVIAGLLVVVVLLFIMLGIQSSNEGIATLNQPVTGTIEKRSSEKIAVVVEIPEPDPEIIEAAPQPGNINFAKELFQKSQLQILQNDYRTALISINNALKINPDYIEALSLKKDIELEIQILNYLTQAEQYLQQGKFTQPESGNAFKVYKELLPLLPAGDNRATEGLEKIAEQYYLQANDRVLKKQYVDAKRIIATGFSVIPDFIKLKQLDRYIQQQQSKQLAAKQKRQADLNSQKQAQQKLQQQQDNYKLQQKLAEANKLAALERKKTLEAQRLKQLEAEALKQQKQLKIEKLINTAEALLEPNQLSVQSLSNSLKIHQELTALAESNVRVDYLFLQIVDSYALLASNQKDTPDLTAALRTIDLGLALDGNNLNLLSLKTEIEQQVKEAEEKQIEVPFVGTF